MLMKRGTKKEAKEKSNEQKKTQKILQSSLELIDTSILVLEVVAQVKEFIDLNTHLTSLLNGLCDAKQLLRELVEFCHDKFKAFHLHFSKHAPEQTLEHKS